jgi:hypothetical protein
VGMSSACTNPVFYGYWNESFRSEFAEIRKILVRTLCCRNFRFSTFFSRHNQGGVARFFLVHDTKTGKMYQIAIRNPKCPLNIPKNIPNGHKFINIFQSYALENIANCNFFVK